MKILRLLRLVAVSWWIHLKMMNRSPFESFIQVIWPLFFATVALFIFRIGGGEQSLIFAALGASVMTIWTAISSTASSILHRERGNGTLELLVAAPAPFTLSILSIILSVSTVGSYGMLATLIWAKVVFGVHFVAAQPLLFCLAAGATVVSFGVLGLLLSVTVVRYRTAWALGSALEYPVWLICGFLVPASMLPAWTQPAAWLLPPYWGMKAVRKAAGGESVWQDLLACSISVILLSVVGVALTGTVLRSARQQATLSLK